MKSSPGDQVEFIPLRLELLHAPHIGAHQANGRIEDAVIEGVDVALLNE